MPNFPTDGYWLFKSEPTDYSIEQLAIDKCDPWTGIRNYQARNFMRDQMRIDDLGFFYHSSCAIPGIVGIVRVSKLAIADSTQFDVQSKYYDPKSSYLNPRWQCVELTFVAALPKIISLAQLRQEKQLAQMILLQKGSRLSIQPVSVEHWKFILKKWNIKLK